MIIRILYTIGILCAVFLPVNPARSQNPQIIPPLPEAAAFFKSTDVPVSLYTGLPNINIPFHTIKTKEFQLDISLNYNARGIAVAEIASRTGLGWALQYGGMISRQIRGSADDEGFGILNNNYYNEIFTSSTAQAALNQSIVNNNIDQLPDQYFFDINGKSGKFIFDPNDKTVLQQKFSDIEIIPNTTSGKITGWIVIDDLGNKYYFGKSKNDNRQQANDHNFVSENFFFGQYTGLTTLGNDEDRPITTWHLMEIETYFKEKIEFFYELEEGIQYRRSRDEVNVGEHISELRSYFSKSFTNQYQIKEIRYPNGKIVFERGGEDDKRLDYTNTYPLKKILIKDLSDTILKEFKLNFFYQKSLDDVNQLDYLKQIDSSGKYRLFLNSITQFNKYGNSLSPYKFSYNNVSLPNRFSNSQDNWGFFNGKPNGSFLTFYNYGNTNNRQVDTSLSGAGLLSSITYPTGGTTKFIFEQNIIKPLPFIDDLLFASNNPTEIKVVGDAFYRDKKYFANGEYSKTITIGENLINLGKVTFSFIPPFVPPGGDSTIIYFEVYLEGPNSLLYLYPPHKEIDLNLLPGTYQLKVIPTSHFDSTNSSHSFIASLKWSIITVDPNLQNGEWYGAGKRIKRLEYWDGTKIISMKEFDYLIDSINSSGEMIGLPNYFWLNKLSTDPINGGIIGVPVASGYGAVPGSPLSQIQGNSLGYSRVTEYFGTKMVNHGKIVNEFTIFRDGGEYYKMPYFPPIDNEWLRGMLITAETYINSDNFYSLVKSIRNKYLYSGKLIPPFNPTDSLYSYIKNDSLFFLPLFTFAPCKIIVENAPLCFKVYYQSGGTVDLGSTTEKIYANGKMVSNLIEYKYKYPKHYQRASQKTNSSKGENTTIIYSFPPDLYFKTPAEQKLIDSRRTAVIIQTETVVKNNVGVQLSKIVQNTVNKEWENDLILPQYIKSTINSSPQVIDLTYNSYDALGSPISMTSKSSVEEVFLWGYNNQYPVAKIIGAPLNTILQMVDPDIYNNVNNQFSDEQIRNELNNIRVGLANTNAQVVTYTYKPFIGMTSVTDPNNASTFYEYDSYGRLSLIRDKDNNIIKKICYNYAGQPEDCNCIDLNPIWENTSTPLRCKITNNKNTGEQEQEQKDTNPCSPGYNQTRWSVTGTNLNACPLPVTCDNSNCIGDNKKCINGICKTGIKVFTESYDVGNRSYCVYHYEWSDGSWSGNFTSEVPFGLRCKIN